MNTANIASANPLRRSHRRMEPVVPSRTSRHPHHPPAYGKLLGSALICDSSATRVVLVALGTWLFTRRDIAV